MKGVRVYKFGINGSSNDRCNDNMPATNSPHKTRSSDSIGCPISSARARSRESGKLEVGTAATGMLRL